MLNDFQIYSKLENGLFAISNCDALKTMLLRASSAVFEVE